MAAGVGAASPYVLPYVLPLPFASRASSSDGGVPRYTNSMQSALKTAAPAASHVNWIQSSR